MRDQFYSDNRDLVKWSVLYRLAEIFEAESILQIAFYRPSKFANIVIDDKEHEIPLEVLAHFRNLRKIGNINSKFNVNIFYDLFEHREIYLKALKNFLSEFGEERCVVFLDPDTGLEPLKPSLDHVLESDAKAIWDMTKSGDVYVFYQHQTNRAGRPWIKPKQLQLENALDLGKDSIKIAYGPKIARDVVFFYAQKS